MKLLSFDDEMLVLYVPRTFMPGIRVLDAFCLFIDDIIDDNFYDKYNE